MSGSVRRRGAERSTGAADDGPPEDPEEVARQIVVRRLAERARSRAELATALARRRVPDDVAERVLDRYQQAGLIDDAAFAEAWVESRHRGRGLGRRALAHELRGKGVDAEVTRSAVGAVDDDAERRTARDLVQRKLRALTRLDRLSAQRRLAGMLARKGYGSAVALSVVREATEHWGGDSPADPADDTDPLELR